MPIQFTCPKCNQSLQAPEQQAGMEMSCPSCRFPLQIPAGISAGALPPPPPPPLTGRLSPANASSRQVAPGAPPPGRHELEKMPVLDQVKYTWQGWGVPIRVGAIGGAVAALMLLCLVPCTGLYFFFNPPTSSTDNRSASREAKANEDQGGGGGGGGGGRREKGSGKKGGGGLDDDDDDDTGGKKGKNKNTRKKLTQSELDGMNLTQIRQRLGSPDETYSGKKKRNVKLAVWQTGDTYVTVAYIEAIDGSGQVIILTRNVERPRSVVEKLIKTTEGM